jgi:cytochrome c-type biogenesis protein CcmF
MIALAFMGDAFFKQDTQGTLTIGQSLSVGQYSLKLDGLKQYPGSDGRDIIEARMELFKNGRLATTLSPRQDYFIVQKQPVTVAGVYSTAAEDVYVILVGWEAISGGGATFKVYVNPLINWAWAGGFTLTFGVILAAWSHAKGRSEATYVLKQAQPEVVLNGVKALGD